MFHTKSKSLDNIIIILGFTLIIYLILRHNTFNSNPSDLRTNQLEHFANQKYQKEAERFIDYFENVVENNENNADNENNENNKVNEYFRNTTSLKLFYTPTCPHSLNFLPIWKQIAETLTPTEVETKMINCKEDSSTCRQYGIKGVPSLVFSHKGEDKIYTGEMTYDSVLQMIKDNGIHISDNVVEAFQDYVTMQDHLDGVANKPEVDEDCPPITFHQEGKKSFCANSYYLNGCLELTDTDTLKPFDGAFSVIGSYLSSVPDKRKIAKCAIKQKETIRNWLLCDAEKLNEKFKQNPENTSIVRAIRKSCVN